MAFTFVPPFEEGDKQTNPETGVEYIFTDGAWRALGPKIEDEFDTLDERYVQVDGDTMTGMLTIKKTRQDINSNAFVVLGRVRNDSGDLINDVLLKTYQRTNSATAPDYVVYYGSGGGANELLNRKTAQAEFASKSDLDNIQLDGYLPLTGGTLTGTLTGMLIKSVRDTGYAFEVKPNNTGDASAFIHTNGDVKAKKVKIESDLSSSADRPFELKGRLSDGSTVSKDFFYMYANANGTPSAMNYDGKISSDKNIVNKAFVDNKVPGRFTFESGALYYNT